MIDDVRAIELLKASSGNAKSAWQLVEHLMPDIQFVVVSKLRRSRRSDTMADAADAIQAVALQLHQQLVSGKVRFRPAEDDGRVSPAKDGSRVTEKSFRVNRYLVAVIQNQLSRYLKDSWRLERELLGERGSTESLYDHIPSTDILGDVEALVSLKFDLKRQDAIIAAVVPSLSDLERKVFESVQEETPQQDMYEQLKITANTYYQIRSRIVRKFHSYMERYGEPK